MRAGGRWLGGLVALCLGFSTIAQVPPEPTVRGDNGRGMDFRLTPIVAKDEQGQPITDIPAFELGYRDTDGDWQEQAPTDPVTTVIPDAMRSRVMLVFDGGWTLVPRGWKVSNAMLTADSMLSIGFVAPNGAVNGSMNDGVITCAYCATEEAAPYFPRARREIRVTYGADWKIPRATHDARHLVRPDGCTVLFDYALNGFPVFHEWMHYVGPEYGELALFEISMADADSDLRKLILADHTRNPQKCVVRQDRVGA